MNSEALNIIAKDAPGIAAILLVVAAFLVTLSRMNKDAAGRESRLLTVLDKNTVAITALVETVRANTDIQHDVAEEVRELKTLMHKGKVVSA